MSDFILLLCQFPFTKDITLIFLLKLERTPPPRMHMHARAHTQKERD